MQTRLVAAITIGLFGFASITLAQAPATPADPLSRGELFFSAVANCGLRRPCFPAVNPDCD